MSTNNIRSYNHNVSPTCLPKHEINKVRNYSHANVNLQKSMEHQLYTKNCRQLRKTGERRGGSTQGRAHQLAVQCQTALKTYMQITLCILSILYLGKKYICMHATKVNEKKGAINFKRAIRGMSEG